MMDAQESCDAAISRLWMYERDWIFMSAHQGLESVALGGGVLGVLSYYDRGKHPFSLCKYNIV